LPALSGPVEAKPHTAVYKMHKYFARRPWNVFSELVTHYSSPGEIILDPFSGGGVTIVEALRLRRKAIAVDVNPLAIYVTEMEARPLEIEQFKKALAIVAGNVRDRIQSLYSTQCPNCKLKAYADWIEWDESTRKILRLKYGCNSCGKVGLKKGSRQDAMLAEEIERGFSREVIKSGLWFPEDKIPSGDKTNSLIRSGVTHFHQLFTKRNLLALAILFKEVDRRDTHEHDFLKFAFSSSLKWVSRQSHLRGRIVEGWALHAYWIYPKSLEINVWNTFERRISAIIRGKKYSNLEIGDFSKLALTYDDLAEGDASCLLLNRSSTNLPIPDNSVDTLITDPPYGGNVNYGELSDFWWIWLHRRIVDKSDEAIINRTQHKSLSEYQMILASVFKECFRVLKPGRELVSTFNSRDARVVSSFIMSAITAGFKITDDEVSYQNPIKAYSTTIHAMQIGAFVGDFIFTFRKPDGERQIINKLSNEELSNFKNRLDRLISKSVTDGMTEAQLRERAYRLLIPFIIRHSLTSPTICGEAAHLFEKKIRKHAIQLRRVRESIIESRINKFKLVKS
jgi:DNA modification methylase